MRAWLAFGLSCWAVSLFGQQIEKYERQLTDVFTLGLPSLNTGHFEFSKAYMDSNSEWFVSTTFSDSLVFDASLKYTGTSASDSYEMRIGKGGQLYSLRGVFGESVAPQWRNPNAPVSKMNAVQAAYAPWVDDVWQQVAVSTSLNDRKNHRKYFIHQAGVYLKTPEQTTPFYSPQLASYYNQDDESYTVINWGQQAHTNDNLATGFQSHLLFYTRYSNKGEGIIQVDGMMYNFGLDTLDHLNIPWGGVRESSLPYFFVADSNHVPRHVDSKFVEGKVLFTKETVGWIAYSSNQEGIAPGFGLVYSIDPAKNKGVIRYGSVGSVDKRNLHVVSVIRKVGDQLTFGKSIKFRYFLVLGDSVAEIQNKIQKNNLESLTFVEPSSYLSQDTNSLIYQLGSEQFVFQDKPYEQSFPIFLIKSKNMETLISSDPYYLSNYPYDGKVETIKLLGFNNEPLFFRIK